MVVQYIMLSLFILILMDEFEKNYINQDNPIQNYEDITKKFKDKWMLFCSKQNINYINHSFKKYIFLVNWLNSLFNLTNQ